MKFAEAQQIADAVLYEGYALYPYRASAPKNRVRWQFGVITPREYSERQGSDPWFAQTECLVRSGLDATVDIRVRCLQVQARTIAVGQTDGSFARVPSMCDGDRETVEWDEGVEHAHDVEALNLASLLERPYVDTFEMAAGRDVEDVTGQVPWRIVRDRAETIARIVVSAESVDVEPDAAGHGLTRVRVRIENVMPMREGASRRDDALRQALVGTHTLLGVCGGSFLSLADPPSGLESAAASCSNIHCWPVLVGDPQRQDMVLSSPIVLYDFPSVAPESPESLFDGTEVDELLTLRILTLTDEEKAEARATDDRARQVIDRVESLSDEVRGKLHGVMHPVEPSVPDDHAWRTLLNPPGEASPESASIEIGGVSILKGSRVRLRPVRRADPIDTFMAGRLARVEGIFHDVDGRTHVAVVVDDDPAGDLHAEFGRFLYYGPEEIEPAPAGR